MVFGGIVLNMEINMDLHHHHTISSQSYQLFSLLIGVSPIALGKNSPWYLNTLLLHNTSQK